MLINNYTGYVLMRPVADEPTSDVSHVIGKLKIEWHKFDGELVIYPTVAELIEAVGPSFDKRTHIIGQVIVHLLSERVEILSSGEPSQTHGS